MIKIKKLSIVAAVMVTAGFVMEAGAADLTASSGNPTLYFNDDGHTSTYEWYLRGFTHSTGSGSLFVKDRLYGGEPLYIEHNTVSGVTSNRAFWSKSDGDVCLAYDALCINRSINDTNSLVVNTNGDINLANGSVFIDRSAKSLFVPGPISSLGLVVAGPSAWMAQAWLNPDIYAFVTNTGKIPIAIDKNTNTILAITKTDGVLVNNAISSAWGGSNTVGDGATQLLTLSANNAAAGKTSDAGFAMKNVVDNFTWTFRTYSPEEGFAASKLGTGGPEFEVANTTTDNTNAVVRMGGVTVFTNGHLVTASSRSLKTDIKPLDTQAALDAFHQLQPVSFAYKAHQGEPVVGFIAEDMPELVAMPSRKSFDSAEVVAVLTSVLAETRAELKLAQEKITKLETMQKKVAMMESILTNLALESSASDKAKVSMK